MGLEVLMSRVLTILRDHPSLLQRSRPCRSVTRLPRTRNEHVGFEMGTDFYIAPSLQGTRSRYKMQNRIATAELVQTYRLLGHETHRLRDGGTEFLVVVADGRARAALCLPSDRTTLHFEQLDSPERGTATPVLCPSCSSHEPHKTGCSCCGGSGTVPASSYRERERKLAA